MKPERRPEPGGDEPRPLAPATRARVDAALLRVLQRRYPGSVLRLVEVDEEVETFADLLPSTTHDERRDRCA